jgi:hypothetical protein
MDEDERKSIRGNCEESNEAFLNPSNAIRKIYIKGDFTDPTV